MERAQPNILLIRYLKATEVGYWCIVLAPLIFVRLAPLPSYQANFLLIAVGASVIVGMIAYHRLIPRYGLTNMVRYLLIFTVLGNLTGVAYILKPYGVDIDILMVAIAASASVFSNRKFALHTSMLVASIDAFLMLIYAPLQWHILVLMMLRAAVIIATGLISHSLAADLISRTWLTERQNRHLSMLLQSSNLASRVEDMQTMLTMQAEAVAHFTPVTACRISILSAEQQVLTIYGAYPIQPLDAPGVGIGSIHQIDHLPFLREVLRTEQSRIIYENEILPLVKEEDGATAFFYYGVKTILLIPLNTKNGSVGLLTVGAIETNPQKAFDSEKIHILQTLANQIAAAIESRLAFEEAQHVAQRLSVTHEISKVISATMDMTDLLERLYEQIQLAIPSDTYYVGLYRPEDQKLEMNISFDEGKRQPSVVVEVGSGFAGWVLTSRQPLLIHHASQEILPVQPILLGHSPKSESYLAAPMISGDRVIGILALAAQAPHSFDSDDRALLLSIASQAALAIDNARQHAEVKEQARRDTLTGAYNHGYLLTLLEAAIVQAHQNGSSVALIMLDVDLFKQYNDTYGHMVGDQVLTELVCAITAHVKSTDIVGRWGGEEFAVALPNTTTEQARLVAERIRSTLAETRIYDRTGQRVPSPTVSQGIAAFPQHTQNYAELVDIADQALYLAKESGRDQIRIA